MTALLVLLLGAVTVGLAFVGYHAFTLHLTITRLEADAGAQHARSEHDIKQWNEYSVNIKAQYDALVHKYNEDAKRWNVHATALQTEIQRLSKWKTVADADVKASEMLRHARSVFEQSKAAAESLISKAREQASAALTQAQQEATANLQAANDSVSTTIAEAKAKAKALNAEAQAILDSATTQASSIVELASKKAEEIGGNAYEAMKNASLYERTVKAMKNIIDGYGEQYLIPQQSLLDDLAEDFSHTQAGQELKRSRDRTRVMIRNGTAAACDYAEANRRETAINFVVDAFNGKVDSILSRAKHDNAGKLAQQIRDACTLVNLNGKAFRDARITDAFLTARLDELKWAAIAQQLAIQEREEQRRIKEQIREEARATKEQERALREAAKEEELLQRALLQAQEQFEKATDEQKAMFEQRIQEMSAKLKEAEERKERARSLAEQTKKGYVYVISNIGSFGDDVYKIGLTRRYDPFDRVRELGDASVPFDFDVHAMILSDDAPALEQRLHQHFLLAQINKVNHRKEFFRVSLKDVREEIERLGVTTGVHWTMTAEAKDYRESLAIEAAITNDPAQREAWVKRQFRLEVMSDGLAETTETADEDELALSEANA